ncbi:metal-dependent hydrolase [Candidatus Woesearchaeota archaeon]|nr:metal-dependent hydrolase [Candidatus Woesearchaeota archaeon]
MMFVTHIALGFLAGLFGIGFFHPNNQILFIILVLFGAAFPDIDSTKSKLGRKFKIIGLLFEHRGFFHSFFALAGILFLVFILSHNMVYVYAMLIGYLSHLLSDSLTIQGIMPLHPVSKKAVKGFIKTGKLAECAILFLLIALSIWKLFSF